MEKPNVEEFILTAIEKLRTPNYKGIHTVYSGFNEAFREYFPDLDPVKETERLSREGKIEIRPAKGGVMIYKPGEAPPIRSRGKDALRKMGLEVPENSFTE